ncbi:MAG: hypothetical protein ACE5HC_09390 [Candidatus Binatia bacterium]
MNRSLITKRLPFLLVGVVFTATSYFGCEPVSVGTPKTGLQPNLVSNPNAERAGAQPVGITTIATIKEREQVVLEQKNDAELKRQRHEIERPRRRLSEY